MAQDLQYVGGTLSAAHSVTFVVDGAGTVLTSGT
jgi:hypothetical protein